MTATIQDALSQLLAALGFDAMAREVKTETDKTTLGKYARIIIRTSPQDKKMALTSRFKALNLI